jgi:hypothetical protein
VRLLRVGIARLLDTLQLLMFYVGTLMCLKPELCLKYFIMVLSCLLNINFIQNECVIVYVLSHLIMIGVMAMIELLLLKLCFLVLFFVCVCQFCYFLLLMFTLLLFFWLLRKHVNE